MFVQRALGAFALLFSWMRIQQELKLVPSFGPLLQAFLSTLYAPVVVRQRASNPRPLRE